MRRGSMVAVACLTFGVILNVAVAWAAVLSHEPGYERVVAGRAADRAWARNHLDDQRSGCFVLEGKTVGVRLQGLYECHPWRWGRKHQRKPADGVQSAERAAFHVRKAVDEWRLQVSPTAIREIIHGLLDPPNVERIAAGWPFAALEYTRIRRWDLTLLGIRRCGNARVRRPLRQEGAYGLHLVCGQLKIDGEVPIRPILGGFVINTLFYAAVLWLLIPGPFVLRRLIRVKRGLCPACAYPMGESDVCSECGKALPTSRASRHIIV